MHVLVYLNRALAVLVGLLILTAGAVSLAPHTASHSPHLHANRDRIDRVPFRLPKESYQAIGQGSLLQLSYDPPKATLPNLRQEMVLHGLDQRPDADPLHPVIHLSFGDSQQVHALPAEQPIYLVFDRQAASYLLSADSTPTNLWFVLHAHAGEVTASVSMRDRAGMTVHSPTAHAHFALSVATSNTRSPRSGWHLDSHRVDNSLLARMHARWYGQDRFLADHGGTEQAHTMGKERLDFGQGDQRYCCFVQEGECLVFKDNRWHNLRPGQSSRGLPLLSVKAVKEKLMLFELWDEMGRGHITLSVMRARDAAIPRQANDTVRFVGARTWSEYVLTLGNERVVVSPQEWILSCEGGWVVLQTVEEIDAYVSGKLRGNLLVLEGLARQGSSQILKAHLYNSSRTAVEALEIPMTPQVAQPPDRSGSVREPTCRYVEETEDLSENRQLLSLPTVIRGLAQELQEETP